MFQEKERLSALEKRYHGLTGGRSFPKSSTAMREVREPPPSSSNLTDVKISPSFLS